MKKNNYQLVINSIIILILLVLMTYLTIKYWPLINSLKDEATRNEFKVWIQDRGFLGFLCVLGIEIFQVVVAFVPGQVVEIIIGMMYGPFIGTLICLLGVAIAIVIIYGLVRLLGKPFQRLFLSEKKEEKYRFIKDSTNVTAMFFFIFLLPAVPKDALIYLGELLHVKLKDFIFISVIGRLPGLILVTIFGKYLINNDTTASIIVASICLITVVIGLIFNKQIIKLFTKLLGSNKKEEVVNEK